jgi:hypothetical protein
MFPITSPLLIKIVSIVAVFLAAIAFAYYKGYSGEHEKFVAYQAEVAALGKAQEVINQAKVQEHEIISNSIANQYEARLSAVHNYYADRVRDSDANSGGLPTLSDPSQCPNSAPANTEIARQCAETTLMLTELQNWVRSIK